MFKSCYSIIAAVVVVVLIGSYVPPTAKIIRRRDLDFKSHKKDWRLLPYQASTLCFSIEYFALRRRGGLVVKRRIPEREVGRSILT